MRLELDDDAVSGVAAGLTDDRLICSPEESFAILARAGVSLVRQAVVATPAEVEQVAAEWGSPVVIKAVAPGLVHRSDVGAVRLRVDAPESARREAEELASSVGNLTGFVVQEFVESGHELIVGMRRDPVFGPFVLVGSGGVWVELMDDSVLRPAPINRQGAHAMLDELQTAPLLDGYRGAEALDREGVVDVLVSISNLAMDRPDVAEVDLNPVIVGPRGAVAVDAHLVTATPTAPSVTSPAPGTPDLGVLLRPESIVVVGASTDAKKQGGRLLSYLLRHGYSGRVFAINPRVDEVMGVPSFSSVADLPEVPDLACIVVPADQVVGVVEECARHGVRAAIVYTSGFAEASPAGREMENQLTAIADRTGMRITGPNTAGIVSAHYDMCAAIGMAFEIETIPDGQIAFLTQSGALGSSLLSRTWSEGIGFSTWVCCGNECDLTLSQYLHYMAEDPANVVLSVFMEGIRDPAAFVAACAAARENGKPVLVYKTGRSERGQEAVASHTAALAGDDRIYDVVLRENGAIRVDDLQGLIDASIALAWQPLPRGPRVAVVSASGGACSVIADNCAREGLVLPRFSDVTIEKLRQVVPPFGVADNPVDVTMEVTTRPEMIGDAAAIVLDEPDVDALIVMLTTNAGAPALEVARGVTAVAAGSDKPIIVVRVGADFLAPDSIAHYRRHRIPVFPMPERAVNALAIMARVGARR